MTVTISGVSAPRLFRESLFKMRIYADPEDSRNGPVYTIDQPVVFHLWNPLKRVLTDPNRNANPFFHVMEFVWMMAGSHDVEWIARFNKNMRSFSDDGKTINGAYGYRWRKHFTIDQIAEVIDLLRKDTSTRRAVLEMWDPDCDLAYIQSKDVPCNTHIYFRVVNRCLNMTVCNRSNDLIWGAMGANLVHMTFLQELIADAIGIPVGEYLVFTNNLHIYESVPNFDYYFGGVYDDRDIYAGEATTHVPLLQGSETYQHFTTDCEKFLDGHRTDFNTHWMNHVATPVYDSWLSRSSMDLETIEDDAWRIACTEWVARRSATVGNQQRDNYAGHASREQESQGMAAGPREPGVMASMDSAKPDVGASAFESSPDGNLSP